MGEPRELSVTTDTGAKPDPELVLTHLDGLPTLSAIAVRLLHVTSDPDSSADDVIDLLRHDQSLTAKVLSVAGSAWTGVKNVTTLEKAVPLLGFRTIRSIALSVSVFECFPASASEPDGRPFDRTEFWKHSLAVASAARRLAEAQPGLRVDPQDAFVAGLLHDLGKVALSAVFPKAYGRVASQTDHARGDIADFERSILSADHTVAGRRLAERWRLPREFQEVIWLHHLAAETLPGSVTAPGLIGVVQLADTIAREQRVGYSGNHMFYEHSPTLAGRFGFTQSAVEDVAQHLIGDVVEHARVLGLDSAAPDTLYVQAMSRANVELGRLNTELAVSSQRLAAGARYFRALGRLDEDLVEWWDPAAVALAAARSAALALQRSRVALFGVRERHMTVDIAWVDRVNETEGHDSQTAGEILADWLSNPDEAVNGVILRAPTAVRELVERVTQELGTGTMWLIPVPHEGRIAGGILFRSDQDERGRLSGEATDLRSFVTSIGLALGRANAQMAARRLSDDLAETNRRLQQAQVELLRSRTLSMIAEMAAGAGHELNSPLTVISGRAQMLAKTLDDPQALRSLDLIRTKAHECSQIVSELMDFARPRPPIMGQVELPELLKGVRDQWLARTQFPASRFQLEVRTEPAAGVATSSVGSLAIAGDPDQLRTVFGELVANAADAVANGDAMIVVTCRPAVTAGHIEVSVRDTGCGMSPEVLQRAFDPFFSHRRAGRGRGLGLPRAYRIVESHGGRIWLESAQDEGTTAHVLLPSSTAPAGFERRTAP